MSSGNNVYIAKREYVKEVNGVLRTFLLTTAICDNCGKEIGIPGLIDLNIQEFQNQLRAENNVTGKPVDHD